MANTHIIKIPKEQFDKIEVGDRLLIGNDENGLGYVLYIEPCEQKTNE